MLIGSGLKGQGGTALVYKSTSLLEGGCACAATAADATPRAACTAHPALRMCLPACLVS